MTLREWIPGDPIPFEAQAFLDLLLLEGLDRYFRDGIRCGGFLDAVLRNDLHQALSRASPHNATTLGHLHALLMQYAPGNAWGSPAAVDEWLNEPGRLRPWSIDDECETCRAKPGSPVLCADCLQRRAERNAANEERER